VVVVPDALDTIVPLPREAEGLGDARVGIDAYVALVEGWRCAVTSAAKGCVPGLPYDVAGFIDESPGR